MYNKLLFGALLLVSNVLVAGTFTYSNTLGAWNAAGYASPSTLTFESGTQSAQPSLTFGSLTFTSASSFVAIDASAPGQVGSGNYLLSYNTPLTIAVAGSNVYAIGFNLGCAFCSAGSLAASIVATDADGNNYVVSNFATSTGSPAAFYGIGSTSPLVGIQIDFGQAYFALDNVTSGGAGASGGGPTDTPEAATLILIGSGLAVMAKWRRFGHAHPAI